MAEVTTRSQAGSNKDKKDHRGTTVVMDRTSRDKGEIFFGGENSFSTKKKKEAISRPVKGTSFDCVGVRVQIYQCILVRYIYCYMLLYIYQCILIYVIVHIYTYIERLK